MRSKAKEPVWINKRDVLALHRQVLASDGGASGVRDVCLLESALARRQQHYAYAKPSVIEIATIYIAGIVRNHAFVDGNKRTGFVTGILFLEMNGYELATSPITAAQATLELAAGTLPEEGFAAWLKDNVKRVRRK